MEKKKASKEKKKKKQHLESKGGRSFGIVLLYKGTIRRKETYSGKKLRKIEGSESKGGAIIQKETRERTGGGLEGSRKGNLAHRICGLLRTLDSAALINWRGGRLPFT